MTTPQAGNVAIANTIADKMGNMTTRSPEAVAGVVQSGNVDSAVPTAAATHLAAYAQAVQDHQANYNSQSLWKQAIGDVAHVAGTVVNTLGKAPVIGPLLQWANKPLQEIQRDYKFISAVYADHGLAAGMLSTLGVLAGGAAGAVFGGGIGAAAGADLALAGERNVLGRLIPSFNDALLKSEDPNYHVSLGRALATGLSNIPGFGTLRDTQHGLGQFVSGVVDAGADLTFDPLIVGGRVSAGIKSGQFIDRALATKNLTPALDAEGKIAYQQMADGSKRAVLVAPQGYATSATGIQGWLQSHSLTSFNSQSLMDAYDGGVARGPLGKVANALTPGSTDNVTRAFDYIATLKSPVAIAQQFPDLARQVTQNVLNDLAKANTGREAAQIAASSLYSAEKFDEVTKSAITQLTLPTRTLGRALVGTSMEKIRQAAGDTTADEERNLLLPKRMPVKDDQGNILKNPDGTNQTKLNVGGFISGDFANAMAGKLRTFTGYRALSFSAKALKQSGTEIDLNDPSAGRAIYDMLNMAMPHKVALEKASQIVAQVNPLKKAQMYSGVVKEMLKVAGIRDDSNLYTHAFSEAQRTTMNGAPAMNVFDASHEGVPVGPIKMKPTASLDGEEKPDTYQTVALFAHEHGTNGIVDFKVLRREVRNANAYNALYNSADDFFSAYTEKIFAPLTLFTSGFGIRVASNEALHEIIRHGLGDYLKNVVVGTALGRMSAAEVRAIADKTAMGATETDLKAAQAGKTVSSNEVTKDLASKEKLWNKVGIPHPIGYISKKIAPYIAEDKLRVIAKFQHLYGLILPQASASSHLAKMTNAATEETDQGLQQLTQGHTPGQRIMDMFPGNDPHFKSYWALKLSKMRHEETVQDIANDYLRLSKTPEWQNLSEDQKFQQIQELHQARIEDPTKYTAVRPHSIGMSLGDPASFSAAQVEAVRGIVQGADGTVHLPLLEKLSKGLGTNADDLKDIPLNQSPRYVVGALRRPTMSNPIERVVETGYRTFINPIVDYISRQPIFNHYLYENYRDMKPMIDQGLLTEDDALRLAAQKATGQMIPLIHNPPLKSQFAMIHRNLMPFYFAQEQAMKRVGRLINTNPQAFRDFQMINQGMNNPGFVHTDSNGTKYIVYPLLGEFGNSVARGLNALGMSQYVGIPTSVTGSTSSLLSVLPELKMPGVGPFANLAITGLAKRFPELDQAANIATGGYPAKDFLNTLMPNSAIRDLWNALTMDQQESMVHNSYLSAIAAAYYHGDLPENFAQLPGWKQQEYMDRIRHNAQTNLIVKGLLAFFVPLSPGVSNDYYTKDLQTFRSEFVNMTLPKSQGGLGLTLPQATDKFMAEHGQNAISYTVSKTASGSGGAYVPLATSTLDWINTNRSLMDTHPNGAPYLIPQAAGTPDALNVEQKLLAMHLRSQRTPQEFLNAVYIAKGWSDLSSSFKDYEALIKQYRDSGNRAQASRATQVMNQVTLNYGLSNPTWYEDYKNTTRLTNADSALKDLLDLQSKNQLGNTVQAAGISDLLNSYKDYHTMLQQNLYQNGTRKTAVYAQVQNHWYDYLTALSASNPELASVITGVFKRVV